MRFILLSALFLPLVAFAQNSVTVTATRNTTVVPDLVRFTIQVDTPTDATLDQAIAAVASVGIGLDQFSYLSTAYDYSGGEPVQILSWQFSLTVPMADLKGVAAKLSALRPPARGKDGIAVSFTVSGTDVSAAAQTAADCTVAGLLADARTQASKLATAAGSVAGAVLSISGATGTGAYSFAGCTLTVKFALGTI
jgi:hypothetical protein